jgi:hypothetical protein
MPARPTIAIAVAAGIGLAGGFAAHVAMTRARAAAERPKAQERAADEEATSGTDAAPADPERAPDPPPRAPLEAELRLDPAFFAPAIDNPYLALAPGKTVVLEGDALEKDEDDPKAAPRKVRVRLERTLLARTETIAGVACAALEERQSRDGALVQRSIDWLAQGRDGAVYVLGQDLFAAEEGGGAPPAEPTESHRVGRDWPRPGIELPATPAAGARWETEPASGGRKGSVAVVEDAAGALERRGAKPRTALVVLTTDLDAAGGDGVRDYYVRDEGLERTAMADGSETLDRVEAKDGGAGKKAAAHK